MGRGRAKDPDPVLGAHAWAYMRRDPDYRADWALHAGPPRFEAAAFPLRVQTGADLAAADWALPVWEDPDAAMWRSPFWSGIPMLVGEPDPDPWPDTTALLPLLAGAGRSRNLDVSWTAPANSGRPEFEHYDLRYRAANSSDWSDGPQKITGTEGAVRGVVGGAEYEVQVRAANAEGNGAWSRSGRATVLTSIIADGTLRLVDGTVPREGRLEIYHEGEWGTICDDYFDATEADLSCRLLGYDGAVEDWGRYRTGYFGPGTGPIVLDNLGCTGKESGLLQCPRHGGLAVREHNCRHTEDVSLRCGMAPRLVDIELSSSPGTDGRYDGGETIELTLVWSEPVVIETMAGHSPPKVWLFYEGDPGPGIGWRKLLSPSYVRGSGTARTVFAVTLSSDEASENGPWASFHTLRAEPNSLKLRRGNIRSLDDGIDAQLGHDEYQWELLRKSQQVAVPAVAGVPEVSDPGADGAFAAGDRIEARVVFDAPVAVDGTGGTPMLGIALGGVRREASYESGSGTGTLTFALTVSEADGGAGAAKAISNGIRLNGGTIGSADGLPAALDFGSAPGVVQIGIVPYSSGNGTWSAGEEIEVQFAFAEPVEVGTAGGRPSVGMTLSGDAARQAAYARGSGTDVLTFSYTLREAEGTVSDVLISPDALVLNGGTIRSTAGLDAVLAHEGAGSVAAPRLVLPAISVGDAEASEGGTLSFRVALEPAASGPVTVAFETTDGTALAGSDYTAASGTLNFKAGDREKTVAVAVADDDLAEGVETLTLRLSAPTGATLADGEASGTVTDAAEAAALTGAFREVPAEHDGTDAFTVELRFSAAPAGLSYKTVKDSLFQVTGGHIDKARRIEPTSNLRYELTVQPEGGAAVTLNLAALPACGAAGAVCTADRESLTGPLSLTVPGPAALSVADAQVREAPGAKLAFRVTLNRARHGAVTVAYATSDGTATAGVDYIAADGTLEFAAGDTEKTVEVTVLDDDHDEGQETLTLNLSSPTPDRFVRLSRAGATGTISNSDAMPKAWLARFGRTVADQVLDAVKGRFETGLAPGVEVSVAGQRIGGGVVPEKGAAGEMEARAGLEALSGRFRGEAEADEDARFESRTVTGREVLTGSAFSLTGGNDERGFGAVWGLGAVTGFEGREGGLEVDGEVTTGMLGWTGRVLVRRLVWRSGIHAARGRTARRPAGATWNRC